MTGWGTDGLPGAAGLDPVTDAPPGPDGTYGPGGGTGGTGGGLLLDLGDLTFGLPVSHSLPGEESVTLTDDTGMTICADTDGDGRVDTLSVVTFDGGWSSWRRLDCMRDPAAGSTGPAEIHADVSSVTSTGPDTGASIAGEGVPGQVDHPGEQGGREGSPPGLPPATPGNGRGSWDARGWECVDRGNWG
ncbi:DUF6802 family protein [Corynebacterium sp.]|uniref:DUF6802 family protein n=1 Tax=Corynebacterium sp. TaxID=1720 RepID=UPI0025BC99B4|nr:DUF6802 family protein [Corynebacterium sp.]